MYNDFDYKLISLGVVLCNDVRTTVAHVNLIQTIYHLQRLL